MLTLRKLICTAAWRLFGIPSVVLIDDDGEEHLRLARRGLTRWTAVRMGPGIKTVTLAPNGTVPYGGYVVRWAPFCGAEKLP